MVDVDTYEVMIDGESASTHRVHMSTEYYQKLSGRQFTHEWVIAQAFQFLLSRKPNSDIGAEIDLSAVSHDYPDFEEDMRRRLHGDR